jgi:glutamine synthetase
MRGFESNQELLIFIQDHKITRFKIGVIDFNGILRGKFISKTKFISGLESGLNFCDVVIGCDVNDDLIKDLKYTGWSTGYPDAPLEIDISTGVKLPSDACSLFFLCNFSGESANVCPRSILQKVISKASNLGFTPYSSFEYEFSMFRESIDSIRNKSYKNLQPISPGNFGYSLLRSEMFSEFYNELMDVCDSMGLPLEGLHTEIGPGVLEAAISYSEALLSADNAVIFKNMTKIIARNHSMIPTFMPKWTLEQQGQSGHIHISLRDEKGQNIFYDAKEKYCMSNTMKMFVAGQLKYMQDFFVLVASTVNDFVRLAPGFWAPTVANWGVDNRTTALRVISGSAKSQRVEYRVGSAASNPYLALSAAILSGLRGIEESLDLCDPVIGNAYEVKSNIEDMFPENLTMGAHKFRNSNVAKDFFGELFVSDFATTREWEDKVYRRQVTDWQLKRYFEII